jgi:8-oxo-dGTP pyrophosphatase MutT (NUDIX family)
MKTGKTPSRWTTFRTAEEADCRVFRLTRRTSRHEGDRRESDWFVIDTDDFVNVVALTDEREVVLVRQFRHGSETFSLELPGGMVDEDEDPLAAGVRELREETGFVGKSARTFASCHPNPAIMNNRCHFVLVEGAQLASAVDWDEHEEMEVITLPIEEVYRACREGELTHSLTLAALLHFQLMTERRPAADASFL